MPYKDPAKNRECKKRYSLSQAGKIAHRRKLITYKTAIRMYRGGKCSRCGYDKCLQALDFHHRDPSQKLFNIGGKKMAMSKVKPELDKCDLLCANCHRELHAAEHGDW